MQRFRRLKCSPESGEPVVISRSAVPAIRGFASPFTRPLFEPMPQRDLPTARVALKTSERR